MNKGATGAKRATYRGASPRELLVRTIETSGVRTTDDLIYSSFLAALEENPRCQETIIEWWFTNNMKALREEQRRAMPERQPRGQIISLAPSKLAREKMVGILKSNIAKIALRDMLLPNGKKLKDCTFGELRTLNPVLGDFLARVAAKGKKEEIVGRVLSEVDLQELYSA